MYYREYRMESKKDLEQYKKLVEDNKLVYEECAFSYGIFDNGILIGAISLDGNCIKQICIDVRYQGEGIAATLVSKAIIYANTQGISDLVVYTKPIYETIFNTLGFTTIIKTPQVLFLENKRDGINEYCKNLSKSMVKGDKISSLVMNLNPITNGHLYLIKECVKNSDHTHLFLVKEDKSEFPYKVRLELLKEAVVGIDNLTIHDGSDYIISATTFPTYFINSQDDIDKSYPTLDVNIFGTYIVKALGINFRYVGSEPFSKTTNIYNGILQSELPKYDVEVILLDRICYNENVISATMVRKLIKQDKLEEVRNYVPKCVYEYLKSDNSTEIIKRIKLGNTN
ncbi:MAG: [citrate (pro-3S)-lyase] ligase [Bacilli bacterium]